MKYNFKRKKAVATSFLIISLLVLTSVGVQPIIGSKTVEIYKKINRNNNTNHVNDILNPNSNINLNELIKNNNFPNIFKYIKLLLKYSGVNLNTDISLNEINKYIKKIDICDDDYINNYNIKLMKFCANIFEKLEDKKNINEILENYNDSEISYYLSQIDTNKKFGKDNLLAENHSSDYFESYWNQFEVCRIWWKSIMRANSFEEWWQSSFPLMILCYTILFIILFAGILGLIGSENSILFMIMIICVGYLAYFVNTFIYTIILWNMHCDVVIYCYNYSDATNPQKKVGIPGLTIIASSANAKVKDTNIANKYFNYTLSNCSNLKQEGLYSISRKDNPDDYIKAFPPPGYYSVWIETQYNEETDETWDGVDIPWVDVDLRPHDVLYLEIEMHPYSNK